METLIKPAYVYRCTINRVIDGDTVDVKIDLGFGISVDKRIRLIGIDTYEVRGADKELGIMADVFVEKITAHTSRVYIKTEMDATGKYGRVLGNLFFEVEFGGETYIANLVESLLKSGYAKGSTPCGDVLVTESIDIPMTAIL